MGEEQLAASQKPLGLPEAHMPVAHLTFTLHTAAGSLFLREFPDGP